MLKTGGGAGGSRSPARVHAPEGGTLGRAGRWGSRYPGRIRPRPQGCNRSGSRMVSHCPARHKHRGSTAYVTGRQRAYAAVTTRFATHNDLVRRIGIAGWSRGRRRCRNAGGKRERTSGGARLETERMNSPQRLHEVHLRGLSVTDGCHAGVECEVWQDFEGNRSRHTVAVHAGGLCVFVAASSFARFELESSMGENRSPAWTLRHGRVPRGWTGTGCGGFPVPAGCRHPAGIPDQPARPAGSWGAPSPAVLMPASEIWRSSRGLGVARPSSSRSNSLWITR
jgi:hypothetical protein